MVQDDDEVITAGGLAGVPCTHYIGSSQSSFYSSIYNNLYKSYQQKPITFSSDESSLWCNNRRVRCVYIRRYRRAVVRRVCIGCRRSRIDVLGFAVGCKYSNMEAVARLVNRAASLQTARRYIPSLGKAAIGSGSSGGSVTFVNINSI